MVRANKRNEALRIESALLNKIAMLGTEKTAEAVGVDKSQISRWKRDWIPKFSMLLFLNGVSSTTTWLDWHDKLLRFSPIKNARRQPSVLNKSRWNSEVITGSINRSHYDKYSKNTQLRQR